MNIEWRPSAENDLVAIGDRDVSLQLGRIAEHDLDDDFPPPGENEDAGMVHPPRDPPLAWRLGKTRQRARQLQQFPDTTVPSYESKAWNYWLLYRPLVPEEEDARRRAGLPAARFTVVRVLDVADAVRRGLRSDAS